MCYFNSIKVRLEHRAAIAEDAHIEFQFHKGAIRTTKLVNVLGVFVNFNSIKVRLERSAGIKFTAKT